MTFRGGICLDSLYGADAGASHEDSLLVLRRSIISRTSVIQPSPIEPSVSDQLSRYSGRYPTDTGGECLRFFDLPGTGKVWIYWSGAAHSPDNVLGNNGCLYTDGSAVGNQVSPPTTGSIRTSRQKDSTNKTTNYGWKIDYYDGSAWQNIFAESTTANTFGSTDHFWTLEVDIANKTVDMWTDGTKITPSPSPSTVITPVVKQPIWWNDPIATGKGGGGWDTMDCHELMMNDDDGSDTRYTYSALGSGVHVIPMYMVTDVNSVWTPTNSCDGSRRRPLSDPEMAVVAGEDYVSITGNGTAQRQEFNPEQMDAGATLKGIQLCVGTASDQTPPSKLYIDDGTRSETAGLVSGDSNQWRSAVWTAKPTGGGALDRAWFNSLKVGFTNDSASQAQRAHAFFVNVAGTGLTRRGGNALYADCVSAAFRRRGQVI